MRRQKVGKMDRMVGTNEERLINRDGQEALGIIMLEVHMTEP